MLRVIVVCGFISVPAILIAGYAVYSLRNWLAISHGIEISDPVYLIILFLAMMSAMWITSGKLISEIRKQIIDEEIESKELDNDGSG